MSDIVKLGEVCTVIVPMRDKPKTFTTAGKGIPWCRIEDIRGKYLNGTTSDQYVSAETILNMNLKIFPKGSVICAVTGASIGTFAVTSRDLFTNQTFAGIVCGDEIYNQYLYYFMILQTKMLVDNSIGSAQAYIPRSIFENIAINLPKYETQKKQVCLLEKIDDKIELNNKINAELESLAKLIYDYWFLQFEFPNEEGKPYKSSGGKMVWNEKLGREIPEGWGVEKLEKLIRLEYGKALKEEKRVFGKYPVVGSNGVVGGHNQWLVSGPGIVIGRKGSVGCVTWIFENFYPIDTTYYVSTITSEYQLPYYYQLLKSLKLERLNTDSAVPGLNREVALNSLVVSPNLDIISQYVKLIIPMDMQKAHIEKENQELAALRDWLLPLLMNGQVGFREAEDEQ